jgi:hypothetical protein
MTTFEYLNEVGIWVRRGMDEFRIWVRRGSRSHPVTLTALFEDLQIVVQINDPYDRDSKSVVATVYDEGLGVDEIRLEVDEIRRGVGQYSDSLWFEIFMGIMT